jgi:hypothetical protein
MSKEKCHVGSILDVDAICKQRDEAVTQLEAWQNTFGTTQLTHALARLEAAEKKNGHVVDKLLSKINGMRNQDILLMCGELSAQEMRTAKALLHWFASGLEEIRDEKT